MKNLVLIAAKARPQWVIDSFPIIRIVLASLIAVCAVLMIILVLSQESDSRGIGSITGESTTYYNQNKSKTLQGKIKLITIINASVLLGLCILYIIVRSIYGGF